MKKYTIEIEITEGNDEFWEDINLRGVSGCDEVLESVKLSVEDTGFFDYKIKLRKYQDE